MNIIFLDVEDVKMLHAEQIEAFGGSHGVRDEGSLASAVNQAQAGFGDDYLHEFPFGMGAAYAFHIAQNQPFIDGNKRAALAAALVFLDINGYEAPGPEPRLYEAMIAIAEKSQTKADLQALFSSICSKKSDLSTRTQDY